VSDDGAHSVLTCSWGSVEVECVFDETPAPGGTRTVGEFEGETIDPSRCLDHMTEPCATATSIAQGRQFYDNDGGVDFVITATIAIQPDGTMIHSFDDGRPAAPFFCPFFETKEDAESLDDTCTFA
jgi:hypothetical protein